MNEKQHDELVAMVTNSVTRPNLSTPNTTRTVTQVIAGTKWGGVYFLDPETGTWERLPPIPGSLFDYEMRMAALKGEQSDG